MGLTEAVDGVREHQECVDHVFALCCSNFDVVMEEQFAVEVDS